MDNLQLLPLSRRSPLPQPDKIGIDLFDLNGDLHLFEADHGTVHRICDLTDHSLLRLHTEDRETPRVGLICDWPFHWRAGKLTIQEVEPEDHVVIHARATVSGILPHECRPVDTWIQLRGPVRIVANPVVVAHIPPDQGTICVRDVFFRKGCEVLSSPSQTLFEISGSRRAKAHA